MREEIADLIHDIDLKLAIRYIYMNMRANDKQPSRDVLRVRNKAPVSVLFSNVLLLPSRKGWVPAATIL